MTTADAVAVRTCMTCFKPFEAPASAPAVDCPACVNAIANAPIPSLRPRANWLGMGKVVGFAIIGALLIFGGLYFKAHTGLPGAVSDYADEMCECHDLTCAQSVATRYDAWVHANGDKLVDRFQEADIQGHVSRLRACVRKLSPSPFASIER